MTMESGPALPAGVCDSVIDVSRWQGDIDWGALAGSGAVKLVLIKATQGVSLLDPKWRANLKGAVQAGLALAPYHFLTGDDPEAQEKFFRLMTGIDAGMPCMLDWEHNPAGSTATADQLATMGLALAETTKRAPLAYYGRDGAAGNGLGLPHPVLSAWPLILPEYPGGAGRTYAELVRRPPSPPPGRMPGRPFDFHQYTDAGRVPGIVGDVDRSAWIGVAAELDAWIRTGALPASASPPTPT